MYDILKLVLEIAVIVLGILFLVLPFDTLKKLKLVNRNPKFTKIIGIMMIVAGVLLFAGPFLIYKIL